MAAVAPRTQTLNASTSSGAPVHTATIPGSNFLIEIPSVRQQGRVLVTAVWRACAWALGAKIPVVRVYGPGHGTILIALGEPVERGGGADPVGVAAFVAPR